MRQAGVGIGAGQQLGGRRLGHGHVEVALGGEVVEQQAPADAGGRGHVVDRHLVERAGAEHLEADVDELGAARLGLEARTGSVRHGAILLTRCQPWVENAVDSRSTGCVRHRERRGGPMPRRTDFDLDGAVALVTGAGSGIGRATALELARKGARVIAVDIDGDTAEKTAVACGEIGPEASGDTLRRGRPRRHAGAGRPGARRPRAARRAREQRRGGHERPLRRHDHRRLALDPGRQPRRRRPRLPGLRPAHAGRGPRPRRQRVVGPRLHAPRHRAGLRHHQGRGAGAVAVPAGRLAVLGGRRQRRVPRRHRHADPRRHPLPRRPGRDRGAHPQGCSAVGTRPCWWPATSSTPSVANRAVVAVGWEAKLGWWAHRLLPVAVQQRVARQAL